MAGVFLPDEIWVHIMHQAAVIKPLDYARVCSVSRQLYHVAQEIIKCVDISRHVDFVPISWHILHAQNYWSDVQMHFDRPLSDRHQFGGTVPLRAMPSKAIVECIMMDETAATALEALFARIIDPDVCRAIARRLDFVERPGKLPMPKPGTRWHKLIRGKNFVKWDTLFRSGYITEAECGAINSYFLLPFSCASREYLMSWLGRHVPQTHVRREILMYATRSVHFDEIMAAKWRDVLDVHKVYVPTLDHTSPKFSIPPYYFAAEFACIPQARYTLGMLMKCRVPQEAFSVLSQPHNLWLATEAMCRHFLELGDYYAVTVALPMYVCDVVNHVIATQDVSYRFIIDFSPGRPRFLNEIRRLEPQERYDALRRYYHAMGI